MNQPREGDVDAALWMLAQLAPETQDAVRRRLALRVEPPPSPRDRRRHELGAVARLLVGSTPTWSFSYVARRRYDEQRPADAPSSRSLVATYGSWVNVCRHAHSCLEHERGLRRRPLPRPTSRREGRARYTDAYAAAALQECARDLGRTPSKGAYERWRSSRQAGKRRSRRCPSGATIGRLYSKRGGWLAALEGAGLVEPPKATVRVLLPSKEEAVELTAVARAAGLFAAHAANSDWVEIRGALLQVSRALVARVDAAEIVFWEPRSQTLQTSDW